MSDVNMLTPVGRMVQGDPFEGQTTNMEGKPLVNAQGAPRKEYFFAIAIPKTDAGYAAMHAQIAQVAAAGFPGGQANLPTFSWKIVDGDAPENAEKTGFPGHWVLRCSSGFQPKVYTKGGLEVIVDPAQLKRGYYIRAYITVRANGNATKPGVYLNASMVELVAYGEEIQTGPAGDAVFGADPAAVPAGASVTPVAGTAIATPGTVVAPAAVVAPAEDFLKPKVMTPKAMGLGFATYEAFMLANPSWNEVDMIAQGYLQP